MSDRRERLRRGAALEMAKIRRMDARSVAVYIWDYYKLWIIGIGALLFLIIYLAVHLSAGVRDYRLYITFAGTRADVGTGSAFWREYTEALEEQDGQDSRDGAVEFNAAAYFDYALNQGRGNRYYDVFVSYIDAGVLDAVTMPKEALIQFGATGRLLDLDSEACASLKARYGDRFVYTTPLDTEYSDSPVPVGIDISDSVLMREYQIYSAEDGCVLGIGAFSSRVEEVERFLELILE